jgi:hypothetical protein
LLNLSRNRLRILTGPLTGHFCLKWRLFCDRCKQLCTSCFNKLFLKFSIYLDSLYYWIWWLTIMFIRFWLWLFFILLVDTNIECHCDSVKFDTHHCYYW